MCFDIDVSQLSLEDLRDTLRRITLVLSKPTVVANLPDKGHQLRQVKEKLEKEIQFRESLEATHRQMQKLNLRCASDSNITPHCSKVCSFDKKPERERFKPHLTLKPTASGKTESMKELHSGTKLIDLTTSLSLQKQQEERVKTEQVKAKQERLMSLLKAEGYASDESASDTPSEFNLSDFSGEDEKCEEEEVDTSDENDDARKEVKKILKEAVEIVTKIQDDTGKVGTKVRKIKDEPGTSQGKDKDPKEESGQPVKVKEGESGLNALEIKAQSLKKESQEPKGDADMA